VDLKRKDFKMKEHLPEDTENRIYIKDLDVGTIQHIIDICKEKFGKYVDVGELEIEHQHIQVKCFGYDQYDPSDYRNYFVITKKD
jgi:hypothetical protein